MGAQGTSPPEQPGLQSPYSFAEYLRAMVRQAGFWLWAICLSGQAILVYRNGANRLLFMLVVVGPVLLAIGFRKFRRLGPSMFDKSR